MVQRIQHLQQPHNFPIVNRTNKKIKTNFKDVFKNVQQIKVSKHAKERLAERNIQINDDQWKRIEEKVFEAREKGVKQSLVVMNDSTLIVSTQNNTVITAMNKNEASSKIFTNIDGTILLNE